MNKIALSYNECLKITRKHYENFPVASLLIPKKLRKHIAAVYAFARLADDIADEGTNPLSTREIMLNEYKESFINRKTTNYFHFIALFDTIEKFSLNEALFTDLIDAFIQDTKKNRYQTFEELLEYCKKSANPVGRILLSIFGYKEKNLEILSDYICTALQLTNFWQDLRTDAQINRIYIPIEDMSCFDIKEEDILDLKFNNNIRNLMIFEIQRTKELFDAGAKLIEHLNGLFKFEIKLTVLGGMAILEKIEKIDYQSIKKRPKLNYFDKLKLFLSLFLYGKRI